MFFQGFNLTNLLITTLPKEWNKILTHSVLLKWSLMGLIFFFRVEIIGTDVCKSLSFCINQGAVLIYQGCLRDMKVKPGSATVLSTLLSVAKCQWQAQKSLWGVIGCQAPSAALKTSGGLAWPGLAWQPQVLLLKLYPNRPCYARHTSCWLPVSKTWLRRLDTICWKTNSK